MTDRIDQFESIFKSADKPELEYVRIRINKVLFVTDFEKAEADRSLADVKRFLQVIDTDQPAWETLTRGEYGNVAELLDLIGERKPDLIVAHRGLGEADRRARLSLGTCLDELTRSCPTPVLILPAKRDGQRSSLPEATRTVMVVTDHLTGDSSLVDHGARMTLPDGRLILAHIECDATFNYFMSHIEQIPDIDTDLVRARLREQLLKAPGEYITSCIRVMRACGLTMKIDSVVRFGHRLTDYQQLLDEHAVDLLVFHTRDKSNPAMHGMAGVLAESIKETPLLML